MHAEIQQALKTITEPVMEALSRFEAAYSDAFRADPYLSRLFAKSPDLLRGKRLRPILFYLGKGIAGADSIKGDEIATLLEMLHLASLVHDDVVDDSEKRRGNHTVNAVWGNQISILGGDYLMARVLTLASQSRWPQVYGRVLQTIEAMTRGELRQALEKKDLKPSAAHYVKIVQDKTAALFGMTAELGAVVASGDIAVQSALRQIGLHFGMAFQIHDDILDYSGDGERMGKPVGQDFQEGLLTLPAILAFESATPKERAEFLIQFQTGDPERWPWIRDFVIRRQGVKQALSHAQSYSGKGKTLLNDFPASPCRDALAALITFGSGRTG